MENIINKTLKFSDEEKYFVLKQAIYQNKNYYIAVRLEKDNETFTNEFVILQGDKVDGRDCFSRVLDPNILKILVKYLDAPE